MENGRLDCLSSLQVGEDARMSKKILDLARDQQEEIAQELGEEQWDDDEDEDEGRAGPSTRTRRADDSDDDEEIDEGGSVSGGEEYAELVR